MKNWGRGYYHTDSLVMRVWGHSTSLSAALFRVQLGTHTSTEAALFRVLLNTKPNPSSPITGQFILTNHRRHTNPADQIKGDGLDL